MADGFFFTFEGGEGSGKTTICNRTAGYLRGKKYDVLSLHEPGGTAIGEEIKKLLLEDRGFELSRKTELFLFLASRAQLVEEVLKPALKEGKVVLCDRYIDSTVAYQAYGRGLDEKQAKQLNEFACGGLKPDLTIILDVETPLGLKRAREREKEKQADRIEGAVLGFHERVRQGYFALARSEPARIKMINGEEDIKTIEKNVRRYINVILANSTAEGDENEGRY